MYFELIRLIHLIYSMHSLVVQMDCLEKVMKGASTSVLETIETVVLIFGNYLLNLISPCYKERQLAEVYLYV